MSKRLFYVKRLDNKHKGSEVLIPEEHLRQTLKLHKTWIVVGEWKKEPISQDRPVVSIPEIDKSKIECPLCGKDFKNIGGLTLHKNKHK